MAQLSAFGNPFGGGGNAFGGATSGYNPYGGNPFQHPEKAPGGEFDRNLMEQNSGEPALGYYATAIGANTPFKNWLESYGTHRQIWDDYQGQFAARNDPTFAFTNYLAQNDPFDRYAALSSQDQGVSSQAALAPFSQLLNLG